MPVHAATVEVGEKPVPVCGVGVNRLLVKNLGGTRVFLGGPDVEAEGELAGFPLDPGESQVLALGMRVREVPVVPAPPADLAPPELYGRTGDGTGTSKVSWLTAGWGGY
jgi:hypothetical protein